MPEPASDSHRPAKLNLRRLQELLHGKANILSDLAQQDSREVSPLVSGHRCPSPIWMAKLLVRSALARLSKA